jgi:hypothetical protein
MIAKAREEKVKEKESSEQKKDTMKEMMAKAKADKEAAKLLERENGVYKNEDDLGDKEYFEEMKAKSE